MKKKKNKRNHGAFLISIASGVLALLGGIGCCGLPIFSSILALFGISSGFFISLKPYQPLFIIIAIASLAYEFFKAYRPISHAGSCCHSRKGKRVLLWSVAVMLTVSLVLQYVKNKTATATGFVLSSKIRSVNTLDTERGVNPASNEVIQGQWDNSLESISTLNTLTSDIDGVYLYLKDKGDRDGIKRRSEVALAARTLNDTGKNISYYMLDPKSQDYKQITNSFSTPCIIMLAKRGGTEVVTGNVDHKKLIQAMTELLSHKGCCP